ncbi:hypothetical protein IFM89_026768 [Coptis chinensis]|uniref:Uncharacterized protein n=1 Tax=Coptis chinensis TaxID=261450 RepID=A0A835M1U2_9MAGN|nr:hypothetical protein IFM89_026768 [Coptis chinensis]
MSRSGVEFHVKDGNLVSSSGMTASHLLVAVAFYWKAVVEEGSRSYGVMGILSLVGLVLESTDETFVTHSGRKVSLRIWTPAQDLAKNEVMPCIHSKQMMRWDEDASTSSVRLY